MTTPQSIKFFLGLGFLLSACSHPVTESPPPIQVKLDRIMIDPTSRFMQHLEILPLGSYEARQVQFQSVGKMIALSSASNELTGSKTTWAELDPSVTQTAQIKLKPEAEGIAYGVTSVSAELAKQTRIGQILHLKHYHVTESGWSAAIVKLVTTNDSATVDVVFRVNNGHDLYPGTTCEVIFPLLQAKAIKVPATSLIHQGLDEYVWQEVATGEFVPRKVTPVEGSPDEVILSSGISEKTKIIGRGAILLKPQIKLILAAAGGPHVDEIHR